MKIKNLFFVLTSAAILYSCNDSAETKRQNAYDNSYRQWTELKKINGDSYEYTTTFDSWTNFKRQTTVRIENGSVTRRSSVATQWEWKEDKKSWSIDTLEFYTENANEIGSHKSGANPLTIDELYETCAKDYLKVDEKKNTIYFEINGDGTLHLCGFVPDGCVDDCYSGIKIDTIIWLK